MHEHHPQLTEIPKKHQYDISTILGIPVEDIQIPPELSDRQTRYLDKHFANASKEDMAERLWRLRLELQDKLGKIKEKKEPKKDVDQDQDFVTPDDFSTTSKIADEQKADEEVAEDENARPKIDTKATKEARLNVLQNDPEFVRALVSYRYFLSRSNETAQAGLSRHREEEKQLNGTYEEYRGKEKEMTRREDELNDLLTKIFRRGDKQMIESELEYRDMLEDEIKTVAGDLQEIRVKNPSAAARIEYDTIKEYAEQLRTTGFIWTKSRKKLLHDILTGALTSRPVVALMGETGVGKTAAIFAASEKLTGRDPERTVGGEHEKFVRLLATPSLDGGYEFGPLLRAMTGKDSSQDKQPKRGGGVFFDDEFNTRPTSTQREILKFVAEARPGRKVSIPGTPLVEEVVAGFIYVAGGNPPGERYDREETGIETKREFAGNVINVDYLEQSAENPELYQILLAALLDADTKRLTAITPGEAEPGWQTDAATGVQSLNLDKKSGGFLWRFANCWKELFNAFSHKDTILHQQNSAQPKDAYYLDSFILDPGVVISWLDQYKADPSARRQHIEVYLTGKLTTYLSQFEAGEQDIVKQYLAAFDIADTKDVKKPEMKILTPKEIGFLNPNVPRPQETPKEKPPRFETHEIFAADGTKIEYVKETVGDWPSGAMLTKKKDAPVAAPDTLTVLGLLKRADEKQPDKTIIVCDLGNKTGRIFVLADVITHYELPVPETGKPFAYDRAKANEYGLTEVTVKGHPKAQELIDKLMDKDQSFTKTEQQPDPTDAKKKITVTVFDPEKVKAYWTAYCADLPNIPEKSIWYFEQAYAGRLADTIDSDSKTTLTAKHTPHFGNSEFMLAMDWPEFDWDNAAEKNSAVKPCAAIMKRLFGKDDMTVITRDEINAALWQDHDRRIPSNGARAVMAELVPGQDNNQFELRLINYDEYARAVEDKGWGEHNLWTHADSYFFHEGGARRGLFAGYRGAGGAAYVGSDWRGARHDGAAVRLVLARK